MHGERADAAPSYCGKDCQTAHWPAHKTDCNNTKYRKQLYRTGQVAKEIFEYTRRTGFEEEVLDAHSHEGRILLSIDVVETSDAFREFPNSLKLNSQEISAVLANGWSSWGVDRMGKFVMTMLQGSCNTLKEVQVIPLRKGIVFINNEPMRESRHTVFKLDLKDGNSYALDLTGAQYGRYEIVIPWAEFKEGFCHEGYETYYMGWSAAWKRGFIENRRNLLALLGPNDSRRLEYNLPELMYLLQDELTAILNKVLRDWSNRTPKGVGKVVRGSTSAFDEQVRQFRRELETEVEKYVDEGKRTDWLAARSSLLTK